MSNSLLQTPLLRVVVNCFWRSFKQGLFGTYRPELHYMRGPGPKWHAKHRGSSQADGSA
jgi:hypothetical protein